MYRVRHLPEANTMHVRLFPAAHREIVAIAVRHRPAKQTPNPPIRPTIVIGCGNSRFEASLLCRDHTKPPTNLPKSIYPRQTIYLPEAFQPQEHSPSSPPLSEPILPADRYTISSAPQVLPVWPIPLQPTHLYSPHCFASSPHCSAPLSAAAVLCPLGHTQAHKAFQTPKTLTSKLAIDPRHECTSIDRFGRTSLVFPRDVPFAIVLSKLSEFIAEPEQPDLFVEIRFFEFIPNME